MASTSWTAALLCLATVLLSMCSVKGDQVSPKWAAMPIRPSHGSAPPADKPITYQGGPVMSNPINVYPIWYGKTGFTETQKNILRNLIQSYSGVLNSDFVEQNGAPTVQNWWGVELEYGDKSGRHVSPVVLLAKEYSDTSASQGTKNPNIFKIVTHAIAAGGLKVDSDGFYAVFTDQDVTVKGFCSEFCGYHDFATYSGQTLKYTMVGNPGKQCPTGCTTQPKASPNGDAGVDGMASVFSHELAEAASDPLLNAWTDDNGENADKCAWGHLGTTYDAVKGGKYNLVGKGGAQYLIQSNWDLATNSCQLTAGGKPTLVVS